MWCSDRNTEGQSSDEFIMILIEVKTTAFAISGSYFKFFTAKHERQLITHQFANKKARLLKNYQAEIFSEKLVTKKISQATPTKHFHLMLRQCCARGVRKNLNFMISSRPQAGICETLEPKHVGPNFVCAVPLTASGSRSRQQQSAALK